MNERNDANEAIEVNELKGMHEMNGANEPKQLRKVHVQSWRSVFQSCSKRPRSKHFRNYEPLGIQFFSAPPVPASISLASFLFKIALDALASSRLFVALPVGTVCSAPPFARDFDAIKNSAFVFVVVVHPMSPAAGAP